LKIYLCLCPACSLLPDKKIIKEIK
jgi:hypothetical protein